MITRFLDALDEASSGLIRLAYLLAGITSVAVYFGAGHLPPSAEGALDSALPWILAFAVETHTYLSARRVRVAWQDMQATLRSGDDWKKAQRGLRVNLGVLAFLLAFSCWNQLNYLYATWRPPHSALPLPGWFAYLIRALVIPGAFMAAAFLAPLAQPLAAQIDHEARDILADVFKIARRQRRRALRRAERMGRDMTGAVVELVADAELRRMLAHAYGAIAAPGIVSRAVGAGDGSAVRTSDSPHPPRPSGPGSPSTHQVSVDATTEEPDAPALALVPMPAARSARRRPKNGARPGTNGNGVRTPNASVEAKARSVWQPGMSVTQLERAAGISRSMAAKYRRVFTAELSPDLDLSKRVAR